MHYCGTGQPAGKREIGVHLEQCGPHHQYRLLPGKSEKCNKSWKSEENSVLILYWCVIKWPQASSLKKCWIYYIKGSVNQEFNMAFLGLLIRIGLMVHKADIDWTVFLSWGSGEEKSTSKFFQLVGRIDLFVTIWAWSLVFPGCSLPSGCPNFLVSN